MVGTPSEIRVILVDDHAFLRAGIRQFIESAEDIHVVAEAEDGEAAKSLILQHKPDAAILDIQMPKTSGIEVTRWIRAQKLPIGVLILTAFDDDLYVHALLQAGANGYVLKASPPDSLIQAVREVYIGKSVLDQAISQKFYPPYDEQTLNGPLLSLTNRELEVLELVGGGYTNKAIALQLGISDRTVQGHLANIFHKIQASNRTEAVLRAMSLGWLPTNLGQYKA